MSVGQEPNQYQYNRYSYYDEWDRSDGRDPQRGAWPNGEQTQPMEPLESERPANPQIIQAPQQPQPIQMNQSGPPSGPVYPGYYPVEREEDERDIRRRRAWNVDRVAQVIYVILGALDTLLVIRFVLKLLAANPGAAFTAFIYGLTNTLVIPFQDVFPSPQNGNSILDLPALLAIIVYSLFAWLIVSLLEALASRGPRNV